MAFLIASRDRAFVAGMEQLLEAAADIYVATTELEVRRLEEEGLLFRAWIVDAALEWDVAWLGEA